MSLVKDSIITCDPNALTLQVPKCAFESINFDWSKAYLAGPDKTPQLDGNDLNPCTGVENGNEIVFRNCDPNNITIIEIHINPLCDGETFPFEPKWTILKHSR